MFGFSRAVEYALIALIHLAELGHKAPVSVNAIAEKEGLPRDYLSKIMPTLVGEKIVRSVRGIGGGFVLARHPAEISLLDVARSVEGTVEVAKCMGTEDCCPLYRRCRLIPVVDAVQGGLSRVLDGISLADALAWELAARDSDDP